MLRFSDLGRICPGQILQLANDREITYLITDSRKALTAEGSLFFCIYGERFDGHQFIAELYASGIRQFITERTIDMRPFADANFILVDSTVEALQQIAQAHRQEFTIPVIGITGSNGKTIIKEWAYQLLAADFNIVKNPGSYNSQIGVPLSVWQMKPYHQLAIFEAGVSKPLEMERLQQIIRPTIGIFTNLGTAHDEGFEDRYTKAKEKAKLFAEAETIIYCADDETIARVLKPYPGRKLSWALQAPSDIAIRKAIDGFSVNYKGATFPLRVPFADRASQENCFHCVALLLHFDYSAEAIQQRINTLKAVPMRLELKQAINNCQVIDDTYNNDLGGLQISLDFLAGLQKSKKTIILSDILQSGLDEDGLINNIRVSIQKSGVQRFIGIGPVLHSRSSSFSRAGFQAAFYESTEAFLSSVNWDQFEEELILVKGARVFQFERIVQRLQRKIHGTVMEIDLNKIVHNLNFFKSRLHPGVKLMVMVKAFAYGSGSGEVANLLQYHKADYLGVAYADEGVELRKSHISLPIMVMNPTAESFDTLLTHRLEPAVYNLKLLKSLVEYLNGRPVSVHFEFDTGMHRLGFEDQELNEALAILKQNKHIHIASVFSHLAGADEAKHDAFSREQASRFEDFYKRLTQELGVKPLRHILNSPGILRFPDLQMDMVRLGIGLYGVNPTEDRFNDLQPVATLKTIVSQIRKVKEGESIGYGRKGQAHREMVLATIAIGYADGFSRSFSKGKGSVLINGKRAPVSGNVCMDMTMVDITGIEAREGDEVIIFGEGLPIQEVAESINTIPYEILTNTSERVRRVFYAESI